MPRKLVDADSGLTISVKVTQVTAFSVEALVTVNIPSHVMCVALTPDEPFDLNKLLSQNNKQYISCNNFEHNSDERFCNRRNSQVKALSGISFKMCPASV